MVEAVKRNYPQREIADASFELQTEIDAGRRIVVGVNALHRGRRRADADPARSTRRWSASRSTACRPCARAATRRRSSARSTRCARPPRRPDANLMPPLLDAARVHATEGEIVEALQGVFGRYTEAPVF